MAGHNTDGGSAPQGVSVRESRGQRQGAGHQEGERSTRETEKQGRGSVGRREVQDKERIEEETHLAAMEGHVSCRQGTAVETAHDTINQPRAPPLSSDLVAGEAIRAGDSWGSSDLAVSPAT
eukprot:763252-Hanusia_phi.AAC.5